MHALSVARGPTALRPIESERVRGCVHKAEGNIIVVQMGVFFSGV